ncbi:MAG: hypothetical protein JWN69_237 [Alphaproteobacteria bacterium]|nr:hypothetical protein [Alphaproteobacteria bacterium]
MGLRLAPADGSRDPRIEDPSNLYLVHATGRLLLPFALRAGISANAVSITGLAIGAAAAMAYAHRTDWRLATLGLLLCIAWLIADGLDGMIARATKTSSALGRALDGLCDHGVFFLLYFALAWSIGTTEAWVLGTAAGIVHGIQSNLYEAERTRFHRRIKGDPGGQPLAKSRNPLVRLYDAHMRLFDRWAVLFDRELESSPNPEQLGAAYGERAVAPLKMMSLLSGNMRVLVIYLACLAGDPRLFWWFELIPQSLVAFGGIFWHRGVEATFVRESVSRFKA